MVDANKKETAEKKSSAAPNTTKTESKSQAHAQSQSQSQDQSKSAPQTTEVRLEDIEKRLADLEANKCEVTEKLQKCWKDCKVPSQQEVRNWIKDNPFLALTVAVLATAVIVLMLS